MLISELELGWLAGIMDGEGGARIYRRANGRFWWNVQPVTNTDPQIIERALACLDSLGLAYWQRRNTNHKKATHYSVCYEVRINKVKDAQRFLDLIIPHLTGSKKHHAELVAAFLRLPLRTKQFGHGRKKPEELAKPERDLYEKQQFRPKPQAANILN